MGMDLRRGEDGISVSVFSWARAYAFAIEGGWNPQGTLPPEHLAEEEKANWPGTYDTNDNQIITAEDALAMAIALEKMLNTLGEPEEIAERGPALWGGYDQPRDYFTPKGKRMLLKALIHFLKGGACKIT
jgi:hypothetical protein